MPSKNTKKKLKQSAKSVSKKVEAVEIQDINAENIVQEPQTGSAFGLLAVRLMTW